MCSATNYVTHINPKGQSTVTSGDLNNITISEERVYNNPSNLPTGTSGFVICKTTIVDSNTGYQEIQFITSQTNTIYYDTYPHFIRSKTASTWQEWMKVDVMGCYRIETGANKTTSCTCDTTGWRTGLYLISVLGTVESTTRACSMYMCYLSNSGDTGFIPIVETTNSKITSFVRDGSNNRLFTLTFDTNYYHCVYARRL